jgi:outer membrane protein
MAVLVFMVIGPALGVAAQQITRFAVVDLEKVYTTFGGSAEKQRAWELHSKQVQTEVDRQQIALRDLKYNKEQAEANGDKATADALDNEIITQTNALKTYFETEKKKLEDERIAIQSSSELAGRIRNAIRFVAEANGYSMVLNLSALYETNTLLWYSQAIDITSDVIKALKRS